MDTLRAIVLGIVQGLTEFLPISSTAHLRIARATIASLQDRSLWHTQDRAAREGWYIVLGTIPIAILGVAFKHRIEHQFRTLELIGTMLIVMGLVLLAADATSRRER